LVKYVFVKVKTALSKSELPDIDYALNPYIGCEHGCIYCYGPDFSRRFEDVVRNWGSVVVVKENLVNVLMSDVKRLRKGVVGVSTITDPYQPIEAKLGITRDSIKLLSTHGFKVSIQTKSPLVTRDLDVMRPSVFDVGFTITTLRDSVARLIEPNAPPPSSRVKALNEIASLGIETWVFLGPIIPMVNDDVSSIEEVIELASSTGSYLIYDKLNIKPLMLSNMRAKWGFNIGINEVISLSRDNQYIRRLFNSINMLCSKHKVMCKPAFTYSSDLNLTEFT